MKLRKVTVAASNRMGEILKRVTVLPNEHGFVDNKRIDEEYAKLVKEFPGGYYFVNRYKPVGRAA